LAWLATASGAVALAAWLGLAATSVARCMAEPCHDGKPLSVLRQTLLDESQPLSHRQVALLGLHRIGRPAVPALTAALRTSLRGLAAHALGQLGPAGRDAAPALFAMLRGGAIREMMDGARALHDIGARDELEAALLEVALADARPEVRQQAASVLATTVQPPGPAVVELRRRAAEADDPAARARAADALREMTDTAMRLFPSRESTDVLDALGPVALVQLLRLEASGESEWTREQAGRARRWLDGRLAGRDGS
jgi:hypothetical protein